MYCVPIPHLCPLVYIIKPQIKLLEMSDGSFGIELDTFLSSLWSPQPEFDPAEKIPNQKHHLLDWGAENRD